MIVSVIAAGCAVRLGGARWRWKQSVSSARLRKKFGF